MVADPSEYGGFIFQSSSPNGQRLTWPGAQDWDAAHDQLAYWDDYQDKTLVVRRDRDHDIWILESPWGSAYRGPTLQRSDIAVSDVTSALRPPSPFCLPSSSETWSRGWAMDKTESGISRSGLLAALYCVPGIYVHLRRIFHPPSAAEVPWLLGVAFGGLAVLVLVCTTLLPPVLRRLGQIERAAIWRRAAFFGIPYATLFTFLWTLPFLPLGSLGIVAGVSGGVAALAVLWWVDRRWLHFCLFKWKR